MLLTKKQMKQEVDRLTTELQLITSQRNELLDRPTSISEDTPWRKGIHCFSLHGTFSNVTLVDGAAAGLLRPATPLPAWPTYAPK